jgi:hypothetical protein
MKWPEILCLIGPAGIIRQILPPPWRGRIKERAVSNKIPPPPDLLPPRGGGNLKADQELTPVPLCDTFCSRFSIKEGL